MCEEERDGLVRKMRRTSEVLRTYYGRFVRCCMDSRDVIGIAHGEESIDRAVLVAFDRVDDIVPIAKCKTKGGKNPVGSATNAMQIQILRLTGGPHRNQERSRAAMQSSDLQSRRRPTALGVPD